MPASGRTPRTRRRLVALALLTLGLIAGLAVSEIAFRVGRRLVCTGTGTGLWQPHEAYGWAHRPQASEWLWGCVGRRFEWRVFSRISSQGLRDVERDPAPTPGLPRVLLLGDSFTEAVQVPLEQSFAWLLADELAARGTRAEIVNAAVYAFGTDNVLLYYRAEAHRWRPDLVLLVFNLQNDVLENSWALYRRMYAADLGLPSVKPHFHLDDDGALRLEQPPSQERRSPVFARVWAALARELFLLRALARALDRDAPPPPYPLVFDVNAASLDEEWGQAWDLTRALIGTLRAEVEGRGSRFAVAVAPAREQVVPESLVRFARLFPALRGRVWDVERPQRMIERLLRAAGIPFVALLPDLRAHHQMTGSSGYYAWDVHLAPDGHRVVARTLADFLAPHIRALPARPSGTQPRGPG